MTTPNGLLLVDKPGGITSHDVVARVRRILGERRVGHAGTLDPMATGLLVLAVGPSTRLLRFAQAGVKRYRGDVTFGVATDTLDADGAVVARSPVPALDPVRVNGAAAAMRGAQTQVPPMVSAVKVNGRRLHALAREGVEVERAARPVTIEAFALEPTEASDVWRFDVTCSTGTYVRVLVSDLAERLGTVAHLSALRRVSSGSRRVEDALTLEEVERRVHAGEVVLEAPRALVEDLDVVVVGPAEEESLRRGRRVAASRHVEGEAAALDEAGNLVAIVVERSGEWQPTLVMPAGTHGGPE